MSTASEQPTSTEQREFVTSGIVPLTRPQLIGTIGGLMLAMLLSALDQTIIGTAEPRIIAEVSGFDRYPWVATMYLLTSTLAVPIFAKLSDMYGRKRLFMFAATLFVLASALCGAAGTIPLPLDGMNQLIVFRALQGIGAGGVMGLIFTIVGDIFSPQERGRYQALFSAVWGIAAVLGPTLGGWLTDHVSWRACFYVNLPVGIVAITAIHFEFPSMMRAGRRHRLDWLGSATLVAAIAPLLLALTWVTDFGWGSARVALLLALSAVMTILFVLVERKAAEPLIPLSLFRNPVIAMCSICVFLVGICMFGVIVYLPLFMQGVLGASATRSGGLMMPLMMGTVVGTAVSGQLMSRFGTYKRMAVIGSVMLTCGMWIFAWMSPATSQIVVIAGMIVAGLGLGLLIPMYTVAIQNVAPLNQMGSATAASVFFRSIGSTVGVAVFGSIMLTNYHRDFAEQIPAGAPANTMALFSNPLMLDQMRPQLEAAFSAHGGVAMLGMLFGKVGGALYHGLHLVFLVSAALMVLTVLLHLGIRNVPLRRHSTAPAAAAEAAAH